MATWLQSLILGIVQGVTEFVPVSSSGHLVLLPYLAGWDAPGLAFDVAVHVGTALAVIIYFRSDLAAMVMSVVRPQATPESRLYRRLTGLLILGSVPIAVVGLLLKDTVEKTFAEPVPVAGFLLLTAGVLVLGERARASRVRRGDSTPRAGAMPTRVWDGDWRGEVDREPQAATSYAAVETGRDGNDPLGVDLEGMRPGHALLVGLAQTLAIFPGLSRSGTTITAGLFAGLTRPAAARFSFLLALPAIIGAAIVSLPDLAEPGQVFSASDVLIGVASAFVSGYLTVRWLVKLLQRESMTVFVRYLIAAAVIAGFGYLMNGPLSSV